MEPSGEVEGAWVEEGEAVVLLPGAESSAAIAVAVAVMAVALVVTVAVRSAVAVAVVVVVVDSPPHAARRSIARTNNGVR